MTFLEYVYQLGTHIAKTSLRKWFRQKQITTTRGKSSFHEHKNEI